MSSPSHYPSLAAISALTSLRKEQCVGGHAQVPAYDHVVDAEGVRPGMPRGNEHGPGVVVVSDPDEPLIYV